MNNYIYFCKRRSQGRRSLACLFMILTVSINGLGGPYLKRIATTARLPSAASCTCCSSAAYLARMVKFDEFN